MAIFRGMIFFLTARLLIMGNSLTFSSQTQDRVSRKHLLFFFPMAPLTRILFSVVFAVQEFIWEIAQTRPPSSQK